MLFSLVFLLFAIVCFIFAWLLYRFQKSFEKNCEHTTATIVGYRTEDYSSYDYPRVRFWYEGKEVMTGAQAVRSRNRPLPGTQVPIAYVKNSFAGHDTWSVRIIEDGKMGTSGTVGTGVLLVFALIFMILSFSSFMLFAR